MKLTLTRYWFEFDLIDPSVKLYLKAGCGVTAWSYDDAIFLLDKYIFKGKPMPVIKKLTENIDLTTLDANHILPNIYIPCSERGIWYPMGFSNL